MGRPKKEVLPMIMPAYISICLMFSMFGVLAAVGPMMDNPIKWRILTALAGVSSWLWLPWVWLLVQRNLAAAQ